jgi:hypothetical protein
MTSVTTLQNSTTTAVNNLGTSAISVIGANATRTKLTFRNPGTVDIVVAPATVLTGAGGSVALVLTLGSLGGGSRVFANGGDVSMTGQAAKQAYQALAVSSSGNPLTIIEES